MIVFYSSLNGTHLISITFAFCTTIRMKYYIFTFLILSTFNQAFSQLENVDASSRKGDFYVYWGWNLSAYSKSDITFSGDNYDFTIDDVIAYDRQSDFDPKKYLNPGSITIPQYNFRIGYFINDKYNISIGADHMKYVMLRDQTVRINGRIDDTSTLYNGVYDNEEISLDRSFLQFEHTDGLNYVNIGLRRMDHLWDYKFFSLLAVTGLEGGIIIPKTNTKLLGRQRYDEFHVSGYGLSAVLGLNFEFFEHFFIQTELKGGYINMNDIRTTADTSDSASQSFLFRQVNMVFGARFKLWD